MVFSEATGNSTKELQQVLQLRVGIHKQRIVLHGNVLMQQLLAAASRYADSPRGLCGGNEHIGNKESA